MFNIDDPCDKKWDDLEGDEKRRQCGDCGLPVHNIAALNEDELRELDETPGRVCGMVDAKPEPRLGARRRPPGLYACVMDDRSWPIESAEIRLVTAENEVFRSSRTDEDGFVEMDDVPSRKPLQIEVHAAGFESVTQPYAPNHALLTIRLKKSG